MKRNLYNRVIQKIRKEYYIRKFRRQFAGQALPIKLNVGCGTDYKPGWINLDNNSDHNIKQLDLNWDMRYYMPFPSESVDFIFNEHFLEHLTVEQGKSAIQEFLRILKPGGVLRIAMPDLENTVKAYYDEDWRNSPTLKKFGLTFIQTRAERINIGFRWWGHQWLYDWEELERRIREVSETVQITRCALRQSEYPELRDLETREESVLIAEVRKPL
ncbi:MAG: methyltransferase domain-containing protein [Planctomycetia bacterium]|nr:methyltransferase domain-containing protein [Planctomycetia bacterium]